ncbi:hypothetical protein BP6252_12039 [Coleophoma cylindrospora]|uniref:Glycoside hydrolase family 76 protein n=1 Tax=Coleophoma cylindrospora TaxID=1849047 RepID=A0A3D8QFM0_9HELO|nr:hypothetical protein BP6252_12039 [Coleophoma cylindrospora]
MFPSTSLLLVAILASSLGFALPQPNPVLSLQKRTAQDYVNDATSAIGKLQQRYSTTTGLWDDAWWPSANVLTMLADLAEYYPDAISSVTDVVFPTTLANAPSALGYTNFLNGYYDDELWWALAFIQVYDVTGNTTYLDQASAIFEDAKSAWGTSPCGGLWWDKANSGVGAVENELYISTAAKLANRKPYSPSQYYYLDEAIKAYEWFIGTGMINSGNTINNGILLTTCKNDGNLVFTYNQGIILAGLAEMTFATGNDTYVNLAHTIATAAIGALTNSAGILVEVCEATGCDGDEGQFKGVFARGVAFLYRRASVLPAATATLYQTFLQTNANSLWANDFNNFELGLAWTGPYQTADVQTSSSALDCVVGAALVT